MEEAKKILDELFAIRRRGYGKGLPGKHDSSFRELAEHYAGSNAAQRQAIRAAVDDEIRLLIIGFSERLAIVADRTQDKNLVFLAAVAHSIEDFRHDSRENIVRLALVNHVAKKLGEDPLVLFEGVAQLSSERGAQALRAFNERSEALKSLGVMGIVERETRDGVDYDYEE